MKNFTANFLSDVAENHGIKIEIIENYSNPGMSGETTTAIKTDAPLVKLLGYAIVKAGNTDWKCDFSNYGFEDLRVDSLGYGFVIY